jgi:flagellin
MTARSLGLEAAQGANGIINIATVDMANQAIGTVDTALRMVSKQRADLGAYQNRFEMAAQGIAIASENLQAAESRIRDADFASEIVRYTRDSILSQSGIAMLAQANVRNQSALQLLS